MKFKCLACFIVPDISCVDINLRLMFPRRSIKDQGNKTKEHTFSISNTSSYYNSNNNKLPIEAQSLQNDFSTNLQLLGLFKDIFSSLEPVPTTFSLLFPSSPKESLNHNTDIIKTTGAPGNIHRSLKSEANITKAIHLKMTEDGMYAPGSSEVTTATVTLIYPDGTEVKKTITKVDRELTPFEIRLLALYERAYRFQSEFLGIPERFGYFCSGPHLGKDGHVRVHELKCLVLFPLLLTGLMMMIIFLAFIGAMLSSRKTEIRRKDLLAVALLVAVFFLLGVVNVLFMNYGRHASERKRLDESEDVKFCRVLGEVSQHGCVSSSEMERADV